MPRPRRIDRTTALATALALADAEGLAAVSMHAVAARLGVTAMALYRHVGTKAALLDGLVEVLLAELARTTAPARGWRAELVAFDRALRGVARRHPAAFPLLLQRPAATVHARSVRDRIYAALAAAGVAPAHVVRVERLVSTLALGLAAGEVAGRFPRGASARADHEALARFVEAGLVPFRESRSRHTRAN